ncbi:Uncharacterised protein [uncultured Flavonifractor sp.]|nr:Uncharacterised protein [uncultured Flavonifractor sp.]
MRRRAIGAQMIILALVLLAGCGRDNRGGQGAEELALEIRTEYIGMTALSAGMEVTADYGERVYTYGMALAWDQTEGTTLTLTAPEEVAGITVRIGDEDTALEYDGVRLETGPLSGEGFSPVDVVPALLKQVREGFIAESCAEQLGEQDTLRVCYRAPEAQPGTGTETTVWFDTATHALLRAEMAVDGFTVLQCVFSDFQIA